MPKVLLEVSACVVAIVTTDYSGCRDAIVSGKTGLLVKPRDSVDLANAMLELLENDTILCKIGEDGRKLALSSYRDTEMVMRHYSLYSQHFS